MALKIMIVDDSKTTRSLFENILPTIFNEAIEILEAHDGEDGLLQLEEHPDVALIFLDINMPGMMGDQFLDIIQFKEEYQHIKVIIASTESSDEVIEEFINSGACGFIVKPITKTNIENTLISLGHEMDLDLNITQVIEQTPQKKVTKILVVDDSKTIQKMYHFNLPRMFSETIDLYSASDGKEAIELLTQHSDIDIVFLDVNMPVMDGHSALKTIKLMPNLKNIHIVMATTEASKESLTTMYKAGANGYLIKPFKLKTLFNTLDRLNSEYKLNFALKPLEPVETDTIHPFDRKPLQVMVVDDSKIIRKMYKDALPHVFNKEIEIIEAVNGKEALQKLKATPNLAIMFLDQNMPVMDGKTTLKTIRIQPKFKELKVVICTADEDQDHKQALSLDGADEFFIKPFKKEALEAVIKKLS
jgi:CheY-like chemotaxis protein